ncbi:MAG: type I-C CRISPR-associated endonuclease Cas1c [Desulfovibrio sp.]|jgi:CRISPR-associated protein Cas1|nr:type I-C CRISPR-associated endonuclease Cas1c [Desulfovibrio sp.]
MKHLQNTLYITTQDTYLSKEGECVVIHHDSKVKGKIPVHTLDGLVLFGQISCSPFLLGHCAKHGVTVSWLTEYGRFMATMHGPVSGNVLLRKEQYKKSEDLEFAATLARSFLIGKLHNSRTVLRRTARDRPDPSLDAAADHLTFALECMKKPQPLDMVRGIEGEAASVYFGVFDRLLTSGDPAFAFHGRNRRPPLDAVNCLLSFLYTLLTHDVRSALESVGLDPAVGFLHRDRPGRPSLALDMIEEFRPYIADRLALTLINKGQVTGKGFVQQKSGAVVMTEAARKEVLFAWQQRKAEEVQHPFLQEKMRVGLLWHAQARLLARHLRGDLDGYPPVVIR